MPITSEHHTLLATWFSCLTRPEHQQLASHGQAMMHTLETVQQDPECLLAALFLPFYRTHLLIAIDSPSSLETKIRTLWQGLTQLEAIDHVNTAESGLKAHSIDNLRKMLLAVVSDWRIVILKLVERLEALKFAKHAERAEQIALAEHTFEVYAPLANRLGMGQLKWQLEDLAFRYVKPDIYTEISRGLNQRRTDREQVIQHMIATLQHLLKEAELPGEVSGRAKHIYSIYRKTAKKNIDVNALYDTSAFRILTDSIPNCYAVFSLFHTQFEHIAAEFDDYIASPKPNGYRSIHTAVVGPGDRPMEIQIRTHDMHEEAELGFAAHWKYKEGAHKKTAYEDKIALLRRIIRWQKEVSAKHDESTHVYNQVFEDRVYVFTPQGDIIDLPKGATPLDFAYHVHTAVGHRARGAKINGKMVSFTVKLKTGDRVEILTHKEPHPSRDWQNPTNGYLYTRAAINKVRHWFKQQETPAVVEEKKTKHTEKMPHAAWVSTLPTTTQLTTLPRLRVGGTDNLLTQLARCCHPLPGDNVLGYITATRGIAIHRANCPNMLLVIKDREERILPVEFPTSLTARYPATLCLEGPDKTFMLRDVTSLMVAHKVTLTALHGQAMSPTFARLTLTITISDLATLTTLIHQLQQLPTVEAVWRV